MLTCNRAAQQTCKKTQDKNVYIMHQLISKEINGQKESSNQVWSEDLLF